MLNLKLQSRNLEIGIKRKSLGVMNGTIFCRKGSETQSFLNIFFLGLFAYCCGQLLVSPFAFARVEK
jgi:hypothetical protein